MKVKTALIHLAIIALSFMTLQCSNKAMSSTVKDALQPVDRGAVTLKGFLGHRIDVNREVRLKEYVAEDVLLEDFRNRPSKAAWNGEYVGKWICAATQAWQNTPHDKQLKKKLDHIVAELIKTQESDGYLGTYLKKDRWSMGKGPDRWIKVGWDVWNNKYCLQALLTYYQATHNRAALKAAERINDLLIATFGKGKRDILKSGTHTGMAATSILESSALLYEITGEKKYLDFCQYVLNRANAGPKILTNIEKYGTVQRVGNKKAYEMLANYIGCCELYRATGEERLLKVPTIVWQNIVDELCFVTGAPDAHELFSPPKSLITTGLCTETCVQVYWLRLNLQLLRLTGEARFADELHRLIYNHMLAAQHPNGRDWCYFTTMEGQKGYRTDICCCSSNGPRAIALIPTFAYMTGDRAIAVNLYETGSFKTELDREPVTLTQRTDYPWGKTVELTVSPGKEMDFTLKLLLPFFFTSGSVTVNGQPLDLPMKPSSYLSIKRKWCAGDKVVLKMAMPVQVLRKKGRVALLRGPQFLAWDSEFDNWRNEPSVLPAVSNKDTIPYQLTVPDKPTWPGARLVRVPAVTPPGETPLAKTKTMDLVPYSEAGAGGWEMSVWLGGRRKGYHLSRSSRIQQRLLFEEDFNPQRANWKVVRGDWAVKDGAYWQTNVGGVWGGDIGDYFSYFIPSEDIGNDFILSLEFTPYEFYSNNPDLYQIGLVAHCRKDDNRKWSLTLTNAFSKTSGRFQVGWGSCVPYPCGVEQTYYMKMLVVGKTVMGKVWIKGKSEPSDWMVVDTFESNLDGKGVGILCYNVKAEFKNFKIYRVSHL